MLHSVEGPDETAPRRAVCISTVTFSGSHGRLWICTVHSTIRGRRNFGCCGPKLPAIAAPTRAFPALDLAGVLNLAYVGMFTADALFRAPPRAAGSGGPSLEETIVLLLQRHAKP